MECEISLKSGVEMGDYLHQTFLSRLNNKSFFWHYVLSICNKSRGMGLRIDAFILRLTTSSYVILQINNASVWTSQHILNLCIINPTYPTSFGNTGIMLCIHWCVFLLSLQNITFAITNSNGSTYRINWEIFWSSTLVSIFFFSHFY